MNLKLFVDRPVLSIVISIAIVIFGALSYFALPIEAFPDIAPPTVFVSTAYPGANAETVQKAVIVPLEEAINGVENMDYISTYSSNDGSASLSIVFHHGTDPDMAAVNVQNRVSMALGLLPAEVVQIGVSTQKRMTSELIDIGLYDPQGKYGKVFMDNYMQINLDPIVKRISGVGMVGLLGSYYSMRIWMDPDKMAQYKLIPSDISQVLAEQNIEAPIGSFGENHDNAYEYVIRYRGRLSTVEEFENIVIRSLPNGDVLRLKDVSKVELGMANYNSDTKVNGHPASIMAVFQTPGTNASKIVTEVHKRLADFKENLPEGLELITIYDTNEYLMASVANVYNTLALAILLVVLVVYLFLQDLRSTLIPSLSIIVSIIGTFAFMYLAGFTINLLTLFALVLSIGTVVDNAIVVVEAVQSKFEKGYCSAYKATIDAMGGISTAILVTTFVFMAVFIPVSMMGGISGMFYKQFGLTMAVAVGLSAINAMTLSPALCAIVLKPYVDADGNEYNDFSARFRKAFSVGYKAFVNRYKYGVFFFMRRKWLTWSALIAGIVLLVFLTIYTKRGFVPDEDLSFVYVSMNTKPGTSLSETQKLLDDISIDISKIPGVRYSAGVSGSSMSDAGPSMGTVYVSLLDLKQRKAKDMSVLAIIDKINEIATLYPDVEMFAMTPPLVAGYGADSGFGFNFQDKVGVDIQTFNQVCNDFVNALMQCPEIEVAYSQYETDFPQYLVDIDAAQCERAGVSPYEVLSTFSGYYGGGYVSNFNRFSKLYRVMIQADPAKRVNPESLDHVYVRVGEEMAPLSQFVKLTKTYGPQSISRFNLYNSIYVGGTPAKGYSTGDAISAIKRTSQEVLPHNYGYELDGLSREESDADGNIVMIFLLCIVMVFLILSGLFESFILPLVVILAVPCGLMGCLLFANLAGLDNDIYLQIGLIMLVGLLAKTAILITDQAGNNRLKGMTISKSAISAAKERFRPILMTALTVVAGMIPLAFSTGVGSNGNRSLGVGTIGGITVGTLVLLFLVPSLWMVFQYLQEKIKPIRFDNQDVATIQAKEK